MTLKDNKIDDEIQYMPWVNGTLWDIFIVENKDMEIAKKVIDKVLKTFPRETEVCLVLILILLYLESKENIEVVMARYVLLTKNEFNQTQGMFPNLNLKMLSDYDKEVYLNLLVDFADIVGNKENVIEVWLDLIKWCELEN